MARHYIAVFDHDPDSGAWGVCFPDFPGCISAGASFDEALKKGAEALAAHAALMAREGDAIPEPSTLDAVRRSGQWIDQDSVVGTMPLLPPAGKERVNVTLDRQLLARIDAVSANRSAFLEEAARRMLG